MGHRGANEIVHSSTGAQVSIVRLNSCDDPTRFDLEVTADLCVGERERRFLFGGAGLAAATLAMAQVTSRPLVCASAQFVSFARPGERLALSVCVLAAGRQTSQVVVSGAVNDRAVFIVNGALGRRDEIGCGQWVQPPRVPPAASCPEVRHWRGDDEGIHASLDLRIARGQYGSDQVGAPDPDGRMILWARPRHGHTIDVAFLAILADLAPSGIGNALGDSVGGNSLDNVLRVVALHPTSWVLVDVALTALESGLAHTTVTLSTDAGLVMAQGSQSIIVRRRAAASPPVRG